MADVMPIDEPWECRGSLGRGPRAVLDMKRRLEYLRREGLDPVTVLWERHVNAIYGEGYRYEFADLP